jgi:hypothetical protein
MGLKIGQNSVAKIYTFDQSVGKIYLGNSQIWSGSPYSNEATEVINRMSVLTQVEMDAIAAYVDAEVAAGNWDLIQEYYCFALNATDRKVGFKKKTGTNYGATEDAEGYTFTGVGDYFDTGYSVLNDGDGTSLLNAGFGFYVHKNNYQGAGTNTIMFGVSQFNTGQFYRYNEVGARIGINSANSNLAKYDLLDSRESYIYRREGDGSNLVKGFVNGVQTQNRNIGGTTEPASTQKVGGLGGGDYKGTISSAMFCAGFGFDDNAHYQAEKQLLEDLGVDTFTPYDYGAVAIHSCSWHPSIVTSDGTHVSSWYNKEYINQKHLKQTTVAYQPSYDATNKKISFIEDVNRILQADFSANPLDNNNMEVFVIGKKATSGQKVLFSTPATSGGTDGYKNLEFQIWDDASRLVVGNGASYDYHNNLDRPTPFPDTELERSIMQFYCESTYDRRMTLNDDVIYKLNSESTNNYQDYTSQTLKYFNLGGRNSGHALCGGYEVNEIVIFDKRLTTTERAKVVQYLKTKWGLDVSDGSTIQVSSGTNIEQWNDKSGNNNHLSETVVTNQPTLETSKIFFDGTRSQLKRSILPFKTLFIVYDNFPSNGLYHRLFSINGNVDIGVLQWTANNVSYSGVTGNFENVAGSTPKLFWHRFTADEDGNNKLIYLDFNFGFGNSNQSNKSISAGLNYVPCTFRAGGHTNDNYSLDDRIMEIIGFDRILNSTENTYIDNYLKTKWGI